MAIIVSVLLWISPHLQCLSSDADGSVPPIAVALNHVGPHMHVSVCDAIFWDEPKDHVAKTWHFLGELVVPAVVLWSKSRNQTALPSLKHVQVDRKQRKAARGCSTRYSEISLVCLWNPCLSQASSGSYDTMKNKLSLVQSLWQTSLFEVLF